VRGDEYWPRVKKRPVSSDQKGQVFMEEGKKKKKRAKGMDRQGAGEENKRAAIPEEAESAALS